MNDIDIPRLAALAQAATPGPRTVRNEPFESGMPYFYINAGAGYYRGAPDPSGFQIAAIMSQTDADLAALAPETLTALCQRVQAAEAIVEDARMMRDVVSGIANGNASAETMRGQCRLLVRVFDQNTKSKGDGT